MTRLLEDGLESRSNNTVESPSNHSKGGLVSSRKKLKLPTIKLPTFSGKSNEFRHFRDTFNSLIVKNGH
jgi:hypothetical protein